MADFLCSISASPPEIRVLSRKSLLPSSPTPRQALFLPSLDILWRELHYNRRLLFYERPFGSSASSSFIQQLKHSLSLCLVHYFPWCGRLALGSDPPHRLFIDCNDAGIEFVEASIDVPISQLAQDGFQMKPFFEQLCQMPDHKGDCLYSSPLLCIQVTTFSDGGFTLGITQSHVVADGHSLWNFIVSWSECSRGVPLSLPPLHDRQKLALPDPSPEIASLWNFSLLDSDKEAADPAGGQEEKKDSLDTKPSSNGNSSSDGEPDPLVQSVLDMSASSVKKLKNEAGEGFTSYEVICAHFWQRTTASRQMLKHDPTHFAVLANCRSRITPPLPPAYFGNVICFSAALSSAGKIGNETLRSTASRIHKLILKSQDDIETFMHFLEAHGNSFASAVQAVRGSKGHNVASSPRFPVYQVDFGWGNPVAARAAKVGGEGELVLFGGRPGSSQGDVEICTALPRSVLKRLLEDPLFLAKLPSGRPQA
ncbi:hypothetical protein GOP47_0028327 [Adiantum capillus-veneris]|nr:hypothetical protein GOP47_0028327 [Adiantum capillus-veneris]